MKQRLSSGAQLLAARLRSARGATSAATRALAGAGGTEPTSFSGYVASALARLRLLHGVPFRYLVPDARLLPQNSIRFFVLDEVWLESLLNGALSVGGEGTRERVQALRVMPEAHRAARAHQRFVRDVARRRISLESAGQAVATERSDSESLVSGFLLRSDLVASWPGLSVRAWASDEPTLVPPGVDPADLATRHPELVVQILRMERLSPSVLLALFDGIPRLVWLEEPHHGVQYGLETSGSDWVVELRDECGGGTGRPVVVPMRSGTVRGVVEVAELARQLDVARPLHASRGSAAIALELLRAPGRQRFAASSTSPSPTRKRKKP